MNNNIITGLTTEPKSDDQVPNKRYMDQSISKANIKGSHNAENQFKYLMANVLEWSSEYFVKIDKFINLDESMHYWDKNVLKISPIKNGANYRFRLGINVYPIRINVPYTLVIELINKDFKT